MLGIEQVMGFIHREFKRKAQYQMNQRSDCKANTGLACK
jgi:hypothetical protein